MKSAVIAAIVAAIVASGTTAVASSWVSGRSIRPHSIPENRLSGSAISSLKGTRGAPGPQGSPGISDWQVVYGRSATDSNYDKAANVTCPSSTKVISTQGFVFDLLDQDVALYSLTTGSDGRTAQAAAHEVVPTTSNWFVEVEAICADVQ